MTITIRLHVKLIYDNIELLPRTTYFDQLVKGLQLDIVVFNRVTS